MRPKPMKAKRRHERRDVYRGYVLTGGEYGSRWQAHHEESGRELWDGGYASREEACLEIDLLLDLYRCRALSGPG